MFSGPIFPPLESENRSAYDRVAQMSRCSVNTINKIAEEKKVDTIWNQYHIVIEILTEDLETCIGIEDFDAAEL